MSDYPKTSQFISSQLPAFVRADHPMFVSFLEAYYEWLETTGSVGDYAGGLDLLSQRDIDSTFDSFVQYFKKEYLLSFPEKLATDVDGNPLNQKNLIKNIRQFYRAKGSEKSYEFLFRILYNSAMEFYYPKEDILRLSDGKWIKRKSIKTTANNRTALFGLLQKEIKQRNDAGVISAYGRVTDLQLYTVDGVEIAEIFLAGVFGQFEHTRNIEGTDNDGNLLTEQVYPVISSVAVTEGGEDYQPGETIQLRSKDPTKNPTGFGFLARIEEVDTQSSLYKSDEEIQLGTIKTLRIIDFGFNYANVSDWSVYIDTPFGKNAKIDITIGGVSDYPGYYEGTDGQLSTNKKIQDSRYYQEFSYVLKVETSYDNWIDAIKKIIHPAGMEVFGEVLLYRKRIDTIDASHNELRVFENPLIGHYTPYTFQTYENLRNNSAGVDLYPNGYNPFSCAVSGGSGRGTVAESGVTAHNPHAVPSSEVSITGPLSSNINDILGHNAHCPDFDLNNIEHGTEGCSGGWIPCEFTPFAISGGDTNADGLTGGYGCCTDTQYWIIYPHPNSRGINYIPPTETIKRIWLYSADISNTTENATAYPIAVHEKITQKRKEDNINYDRATGSDLRPFVEQQVEAEVGIVYDVKWYGDDTTVVVPGEGAKPLAHIDVLPNTSKFMDSSYVTEGLTGYFLETNFSKVALNMGEAASFIGRDRLGEGVSGSIKAAVKTEDIVIPNRFLHIIIDDFLHMPIDTGTTGNAFKQLSTTQQDLSYQQMR